MYIFISVNMYAIRRCTHGVPTVYPYLQYQWLTQPEGRQVRVLTGTGTGQPGITRGLPVLIPTSTPPLASQCRPRSIHHLLYPPSRLIVAHEYFTLPRTFHPDPGGIRAEW